MTTFTLPHISCHTPFLLGSLFCIIYKSDLLHIWTAVETAGLCLSCVTRIQIGRSSIFTAAFDSVCNGIQWIHILQTTVLLRLLTNLPYYSDSWPNSLCYYFLSLVKVVWSLYSDRVPEGDCSTGLLAAPDGLAIRYALTFNISSLEDKA